MRDHRSSSSFLKSAEKTIRLSALGCLRRFFPTPPVMPDQLKGRLERGEIRKVLFVGISQKLGQFLCATPLLRAFKNTWPLGSLHFLGNPVNAPAARANPCIDRVWTWDRSFFWKPGRSIGFLKRLRKERFDVIVLLTTEMPSTTGLLLARSLGAWCVTGYGPQAQDSTSPASFYHLPIPYSHEVNEVEKFLGLGHAFGLTAAGRVPEFIVSHEDQKEARLFFETHSLSRRPRIGLFLGGKIDRPERLWPVSHFTVLAKSLENQGFQWLAISPPDQAHEGSGFDAGEEKRLKEFLAGFSTSRPVFQDGSLGRVAAFLKELDLFICPDGGMMHLAVAVGTPTLALFFETDPRVWRHADERQFYLKSRDNQPSSLSVEEVAHKTLDILKRVSHHA
jgi:ADP-heptose:LPS heptosyltransferase